MSRRDVPADEEPTVHREYVLDVRILEVHPPDFEEPRYRFEAPDHVGTSFESPGTAELYADVYFDVNGFEEAGTGDRGIPPEIIQGGRDTMAAYMLTQPYADPHYVASFYGKKPSQVQRYVGSVKKRAREVREGAADLGLD